jgi:hypothetical protein
MIDPGLVQEAERTHASVIWLVGFGGIGVTTSQLLEHGKVAP